jgi:hypothetical protein
MSPGIARAKAGERKDSERSALERLRPVRPVSREQLRQYVQVFLEMAVPERRICPGHSSPMDYLWHSYSVDFAEGGPTNGDCVVWANRGGGKTQLAAAATLLEGMFKPGCQSRMLAGSLDQANRMYDYLRGFVENGFESYVEGRMLSRVCRFVNGARAEALPQSATAIRGRHIHKLRCDEMELFDTQVFEAAQFVTHRSEGLRGAMEMLSTLHRPYGVMQRVIERAETVGIPTFRWCMWETIEPCAPERSCSRCALWSDCGGKARQAAGYLSIDDCIGQMRRSSRAGFEAEMLCLRPSLENAVFAEFDPAVHVQPVGYRPDLPLYRTIDFGFVNPFVCLWIQTDDAGRVFVIDEYVQRQMTVAEHAEEIKRRMPGAPVAGTFCDPAGKGRNDITGSSSVRELAAAGVRATYRKSGILEGIEKIRAALRCGDGTHRLAIAPACVRLIEAMRCYHYPSAQAGRLSELPDKDGLYDHPIDALRYFFVNCPKPAALYGGRY